ncbi:hypothetical protein ACFV30_41995 [Streptomyces sp. NPDC059752]|uniref:hypothetical protein n=1 Tax=unclassified Streptomyces TaxID=2593676 RepID=UPI003648745E
MIGAAVADVAAIADVADVAGLFPGHRSGGGLAAFFVRAGRSSRSSSREGVLQGEADAGRFDALAAVLSARGLPFSVEFYGEDGALLREVHVGLVGFMDPVGPAGRVGPVGPVSPAGPAGLVGPAGPRRQGLPVRPRQGMRQRLSDLFTRKG